MRWIALLLILSSAAEAQRLQRFCSRTSQGRSTRGFACDSFAFFELLPVGGAGSVGNCTYPNTCLQSETFQTTWSVNSDSAPTLGTLTVNYATAPDGALTADRLQLPETVGPGQYSRILQSGIAVHAGVSNTCSVWVKGNVSAGSLPLYVLTGFPGTSATCSYTTAWGLCSITWTPSGATDNFYIGASGVAGTVPAQDISLWGAMCNPGTSRGVYVATTTVAKGANPTGAKGEAMTAFTRTGAATCSTSANGIFTTSGIANGALRELAADQLRVETNSLGQPEMLIEQTKTNVLLRFIDYANLAWADVGTPTLTGGQTSPWSGTYATSAVQFDDNAAGAFEGRSQTVTVTAATAYIMHCYIKAGTAAEARLSLDGTTADVTGLSSSTWTIHSVADASSSGVGISAQVLVGDAVGDTGTIIVGGCQVEAGTYRTSMIPTLGTTIARGADTNPSFGGVTLTALATRGCSAVNVTPLGTSGMSGVAVFMNTAGRPLYSAGPNLRMFDGTVEPSLAANHVGGSRKRYRSTWSVADGQDLFNVTDVTTSGGAFDGAMDTTGPLIVGASSVVGLQADWRVGAVQLDPSPARCQ